VQMMIIYINQIDLNICIMKKKEKNVLKNHFNKTVTRKKYHVSLRNVFVKRLNN